MEYVRSSKYQQVPYELLLLLLLFILTVGREVIGPWERMTVGLGFGLGLGLGLGFRLGRRLRGGGDVGVDSG